MDATQTPQKLPQVKPQVPSPLSPHVVRRQVQRLVRNSFSSLAAAKGEWDKASSRGLRAAKGFMNSFLNESFVPSMDFGGLSNSNETKQKAEQKLQRQQALFCGETEAAFSELLVAAEGILSAAADVANFSKTDQGASFRGAVFCSLPLKAFEMMAAELSEMILQEAEVKRLIVAELNRVCRLKSAQLAADVSRGHDDDVSSRNEASAEAENANGGVEQEEGAEEGSGRGMEMESKDSGYPNKISGGKQGVIDDFEAVSERGGRTLATIGSREKDAPSRETLQIYLTSWMAEVCINKRRWLEVMNAVSEEVKAAQTH